MRRGGKGAGGAEDADRLAGLSKYGWARLSFLGPSGTAVSFEVGLRSRADRIEINVAVAAAVHPRLI